MWYWTNCSIGLPYIQLDWYWTVCSNTVLYYKYVASHYVGLDHLAVDYVILD
jgi:hypothetical protein